MRSATELSQRVVTSIWRRNAGTYFIDGAPGSGKSALLRELAWRLPEQVPRSLALGPYAVQRDEPGKFFREAIRDCRDAGFLDSEPDAESERDLAAAWAYFAANAYVGTDHTFLVLVDLGDIGLYDLESFGNLLSHARELEGIWTHRKIRLFHLFAGYWDHQALMRRFRDISTSFPYTLGDNYTVWTGVSPSAMGDIVVQASSVETGWLYTDTVFELTGGHPAAAKRHPQPNGFRWCVPSRSPRRNAPGGGERAGRRGLAQCLGQAAR
jgi:hypothetical protein